MKDINIFNAIKSGLFKYNRNPLLIKLIPLESYLKYSSNLHKLSKAIIYSMLTSVKDRNNIEWNITFNACTDKKDSFWKNIAVYTYKDNIESFSDLILIDYSILRVEKEKDLLFSKYPQIKDILLLELRLYK